jgi:hypothetical protein
VKRFIISLLLFTFAWSNLAGAAEALAHTSQSEDISHELHDTAHSAASSQEQSHDEQLEDKAHHHCTHNLVGLAFTLPTAQRADATNLLSSPPPKPHYFALQQRLLRPPRI